MRPIEEKINLLIQDAQEGKIFFGSGGLFSPNEIPSGVIDYLPEDELRVRSSIQDIQKAIGKGGNILYHCDLYQAVIDIATTHGRYPLDRLAKLEEEYGFEYVASEVIKTKVEGEAITQYIKEKSEGANIVIMTRIGTARPFLRVHNLLNNLIESLHNKPVILLYPGEYNHLDRIKGFSLFGKFVDAHYYRAFRLYA